MIHEDNVSRYQGTLEELAVDIGDLRYDVLAVFLKHLSDKLERDGVADAKRNRPKLANSLSKAACEIMKSSESIEKAWNICEPFMVESEGI